MFSLFIRCYTVNYAQFAGRASRKEFWSFMLFSILFIFLICIITILVLIKLASHLNEGEVYLYARSIGNFLLIIYLIPSTALTARRLHDLNISGWWALLNVVSSFLGESLKMITFFIAIGFLIIGCLKGNEGSNQFGSDPLEIDTDN